MVTPILQDDIYYSWRFCLDFWLPLCTGLICLTPRRHTRRGQRILCMPRRVLAGSLGLLLLRTWKILLFLPSSLPWCSPELVRGRGPSAGAGITFLLQWLNYQVPLLAPLNHGAQGALEVGFGLL